MSETTRRYDGVDHSDRAYSVYVADGKQILDAHGGVVAQAARALDARRLAACANACNGIPTRELEAGILEDLFAACGRQSPERIRAILSRLELPERDSAPRPTAP